MKKYLIAALCLCVLLGGCGKRNDGEERVLEGFDNTDVQEVKDFSSYEETEPPTEPATEPLTVPQTEPPTEPVTEPAEEPFSADYELSEYNVLQAVFSRFGGLGAIPYESTVTQDMQARTRVQTVTAMDGGIVVTMEADAASGTSYKKVTLDYSTADAQEDIQDALAGFDNGISMDNIGRFMEGAYSGGNAPLIGLADASYTYADGHAVAVLVKNDVAEGEVPGWEVPDMDSAAFLASAKFHKDVSDGADLFSEMLQGLEFGPVIMDGASFTSYRKVTDEKGNVTAESAVFLANYHTDDGHSYEVTLSNENAETEGLTVVSHRPDAATPEAVMALSGHLYQYVFEGMPDLGADPSAGYSMEHFNVTKTDDGFTARFF